MTVRNLILVLGDQLSDSLSSLRAGNKTVDTVLMVEVQEEATYVKHHKRKIALILAAMRHFAADLRAAGWQVDYVTLDDPDNLGSFTQELGRALRRHNVQRVLVTEPGEWRVRQAMETWEETFGLPVTILNDDRFIISRSEFAAWAEGRKQLRLEYFYREMRRKTGLLMNGDEPCGGRWNFDAENRKPASPDAVTPEPRRFAPDAETTAVVKIVEDRFADHFGSLETFWFAVSRAEAEAALDHFIAEALPNFGDYQDAMLEDEGFLYHSVLSLYLNVGLLDPLAVCRRVEREYRAGRAPLNAAEGFIRQILGWREYVRGIYWLNMPEYLERNFLGANRPLPGFYWTGDADLACLRAVIHHTKEEAYAHHIQRLMVTGNFAMLAGVSPREVHEWYLAVYADAFEWVELPNTLGMSQFADGGIIASKPYAAGGNYINRMSNYCGSCRYDVKQKTGPDACPLNALYWHFLDRNRKNLGTNPRLRHVYRTWDRMDDVNRRETLRSADQFLAAL